MITSTEARRLADYEEVIGDRVELVKRDGILIALIGKVHLVLPATLEESLRPLIGQRIAILRTDLPQKDYLFRVLTEEPQHVKNNRLGG